MSRRNKNDILSELQLVLAEKILVRIRDGEEVTAAEWNVARQLLKDNAIEALPGANPALDQLAKLPKFEDDELPIN